MNSENPIARTRRFKNGVFAALDLCAERRAQESGVNVIAAGRTGQRYHLAAAHDVSAEAQRAKAEPRTAIRGRRSPTGERGKKRSRKFDEQTNGDVNSPI